MTLPDTRRRILATASSHFARSGFEGASLRKIGEDAGITAASIFHHFPGGKVELYEAMLADIAETITTRIIERYVESAGLSPIDAIVRMLVSFWEYFEAHPDHARVILLQAMGTERTIGGALGERRTAMITTTRRMIEAAQTRGELAPFDVDRFLLWSSTYPLMIHGAPLLPAYLVRSGDRVAMLEGYVAMVRAQIAPKGERR